MKEVLGKYIGTTIGINTMILLSSVFYVIRVELPVEVHS